MVGDRVECSRERNNYIWRMGNYRFRVSDMMPNSWFYKLKDMTTIIRRRNSKKDQSSKNSHTTDLVYSHPRKSIHFTPSQLAANNSPLEPPRRSSKGKKPRRRPTSAAAPTSTLLLTSSSGCSCGRTALESVTTTSTTTPPVLTHHSYLHAEKEEEDPNAVIFGKEHKISPKKINGSDEEYLKSLPQIIDQLPPIITRSSSSSSNAADASTCPSLTITKNDKSEPIRSSPSRRFLLNSPGPKLRIVNSPRVSSSKRFSHVSRRRSGKRSLNDSLAIVKSTKDPQRDFRESMVEMIVENKISGSNELEDLLACYLSLNTDEYHDIIVKVFKQIWFDMTDIIGDHY
ncbi:transcription repressor OFP2 [Cucumis sativus]|uniref:Transcription repressor n=1 Tax=Cucumis sativus TaxID=3659 RepID=A0A0A0LF48_CUCSA|nr:transcription repressor OFP2 [Cucumis sativus]KGN58701.1 hypothetical protein Csa_000796 [Cucumis sativus]